MAKWAGKLLRVDLHDGTALRNISTAVKVATTPDNADTPDVTGGGSTQKSYVVGLRDQRPTLEGPVDDQANGQHAVMTTIQAGTAGYDLRVHPRGSTAGYIICRGTVLQSMYQVTTDVADAPRYRAEYVPFDNQLGMVWGTV